MMKRKTKFTQLAVPLFLVGVPLIVLALVSFIWGSDSGAVNVSLRLLGIVSLGLLIINHRLTLTIGESELKWSLGLGLFQEQVQYKDIMQIEVSSFERVFPLGRISISDGLGFKVKGKHAVKLLIRSSDNRVKVVKIGTDEPNLVTELVAAKMSSS